MLVIRRSDLPHNAIRRSAHGLLPDLLRTTLVGIGCFPSQLLLRLLIAVHDELVQESAWSSGVVAFFLSLLDLAVKVARRLLVNVGCLVVVVNVHWVCQHAVVCGSHWQCCIPSLSRMDNFLLILARMFCIVWAVWVASLCVVVAEVA